MKSYATIIVDISFRCSSQTRHNLKTLKEFLWNLISVNFTIVLCFVDRASQSISIVTDRASQYISIVTDRASQYISIVTDRALQYISIVTDRASVGVFRVGYVSWLHQDWSRTLLSHPQELLHKWHLLYCVRVIQLAAPVSSAGCLASPEDDEVTLETCRGA
jgi:hypothetical protein